MRHYCTPLDHNYLPRGLALYQSLKRHDGPFRLWVLCLSDACYEQLAKLALPEVELIPMAEFEAGDAPLLAAKQNRSAVEYYFTCKSALVLFIFKKAPAAESVTYLDGDLFYFANPELAHAEADDHSIAITPHRFPPALSDNLRCGIYNAGWIRFRHDENALECLRWWRERCLEWCYDRCEAGRYTDQKYLDEFASRFRQVKTLDHPGINLAPWNLANHRVTFENGHLFADGQPVIFFHFHGFKQLSNRIFDPHIRHFQARPSRAIIQNIFMPYWEALCQAATATGMVRNGAWLSEGIRGGEQMPKAVPPLKQTWKRWRRNFSLFRGVLRRRYIVVWSNNEPTGLTASRSVHFPANR